MKSALYVETSALLRVLLEMSKKENAELVSALESASSLLTSDLTFVEAHRALVFREEQGTLAPASAAKVRLSLNELRAIASAVPVDQVLARASERFPREHVRTLDAIHLATMIALASQGHRFEVFSTDERVRRNALALGFTLVPA